MKQYNSNRHGITDGAKQDKNRAINRQLNKIQNYEEKMKKVVAIVKLCVII